MLEPIRLRSGLTLVVEEAPWQQGVSLGLFVRAGVVDEPPGQAGIAHLLEHLVFRGTRKFAGDELSGRIDEDGGELNAYTTKEYTCLWGRTLPQGLHSYLELLAELFLWPRLLPRDLRREVDVIAEEYQLWLQSPEEYVCDLLETEVFAGSPLARSVLGEPGELAALDARAVRAFHAGQWRLDRAVLALSGPIDVARVRRMAEELFLAQGAPPRAASRLGAASPRPLAARALASQVHIAVGGGARPLGDPGLARQGMLVQEFGGGPNARLFMRLRDEMALSYGVYSYDTAYRAAGLWAVYADLPRESLREGLEAIADEARQLRRQRWREEQVESLRRSARGAFLLALDSPFARVEREALQILLDRREGIEEELDRIMGVRGDALRREADAMLAPESWHVVGLHPERGLFHGSFADVLAEEAERCSK